METDAMETDAMDLTFDIKKLADRETYEALVTNMAGRDLDAHNEARDDARHRLDAVLPPEARDALVSWSDVSVDGAAMREEAAARAGLALGIGVGAALAAHPHEDASALATVASDVVSSVLAGPMPAPRAQALATLVIETLRRASAATSTRGPTT